MKVKRLMFRIALAVTAFIIGISAVFVALDARRDGEPQRDSTKDIPEPLFVSSEDYEVFSAVLARLNNRETVVSDYASDKNPFRTADFTRSNSIVSDETINDYLNKNKDDRQLENKFTISGKVFFLSREEEEILFPKGGAGWERFIQKYPSAKGIIYFSNVGFNRQKTEALVWVTYQCRDGSCGNRNDYYSLNKFEGKWVVPKSRSSEF